MSQFKLGSSCSFKKRVCSPLKNIQWLDTASLHSESSQLDAFCVLLCAIYRTQEMVVKVLEMLAHGITFHELNK